jgi:hypothetical protein
LLLSQGFNAALQSVRRSSRPGGPKKPPRDREPIAVSPVDCCVIHQKAGDIFMRSKLALSALVVAAMLGAASIASAQTQPAPGASSDSNMTPGANTQKMHKMHSSKMRTSKMKSGTTTGMSSSHKIHKTNTTTNKTDKTNTDNNNMGKY